ncbi:hypothetical protein GCM10027075_47750 [Streptomyces heilongjiangensis]
MGCARPVRIPAPHAADWLRLGRVDRLPAYGSAADRPAIGRLAAAGSCEPTRTDRHWEHRP